MDLFYSHYLNLIRKVNTSVLWESFIYRIHVRFNVPAFNKISSGIRIREQAFNMFHADLSFPFFEL